MGWLDTVLNKSSNWLQSTYEGNTLWVNRSLGKSSWIKPIELLSCLDKLILTNTPIVYVEPEKIYLDLESYTVYEKEPDCIIEIIKSNRDYDLLPAETYSNKHEAKVGFNDYLCKRKIGPRSTFETLNALISSDPKYKSFSMLSVKEKRVIYNTYIQKMGKAMNDDVRLKRRAMSNDFIQYLEQQASDGKAAATLVTKKFCELEIKPEWRVLGTRELYNTFLQFVEKSMKLAQNFNSRPLYQVILSLMSDGSINSSWPISKLTHIISMSVGQDYPLPIIRDCVEQASITVKSLDKDIKTLSLLDHTITAVILELFHDCEQHGHLDAKSSYTSLIRADIGSELFNKFNSTENIDLLMAQMPTDWGKNVELLQSTINDSLELLCSSEPEIGETIEIVAPNLMSICNTKVYKLSFLLGLQKSFRELFEEYVGILWSEYLVCKSAVNDRLQRDANVKPTADDIRDVKDMYCSLRPGIKQSLFLYIARKYERL